MNREDLKNYRYNQQWLDEQIEKYEEMKEKVYNLGQVIDGMPKPQNKPNYTLEDLMDKFNELLEIFYINQAKQNEIVQQLDLIEPLYRNILYFRYIKGLGLEQISAEIGYNYYKTCRLNGEALQKFDELGKKEQDCAKKM